MLTIIVPPSEERWDERNEVFVPGTKETKIVLEHSLVAISKWEEIYEKPFIGDGSDKYKEKTSEEIMDYIRCMTIPPAPPKEVYDALTRDNIQAVMDYIESKRTATTINYLKSSNPKKKEIITSELLYSWMILLKIPSKCEKWFLNRLLTLIELVSIESDPDPKKMNAKDHAAWRKAENARRRAKSKLH